MSERTSDLQYPSPAELDGWGRSVDRAAASHSSLLLGLRFGAASPSNSGAAAAAPGDGLRFQLTPRPQFFRAPMPRTDSVLGRLGRSGSFLPKLSAPAPSAADPATLLGDSLPGDVSTIAADDYVGADPLDGAPLPSGDAVSSADGDRFSPQDAWQAIGGAMADAAAEPSWPDAAINVGQNAAQSATDAAGHAGSSAAASATQAAASLYGFGTLPQPPTITVTHPNSVKLKQEALRAIANDFSQRNQQQFNDIKRSMTYYEASLRASFGRG